MFCSWYLTSLFEKLGGRTRLCRGRAAKQNEGRGEIKQSSCFHWPVLLHGPYFKSKPICPRHPGSLRKSSNGWRLASSTGNRTPRVVLTQPPPLPATDHGKSRFNARTLGWTGVSLSPLLVVAVPVAIRYWQPAVSRSLPGRTNQRPTFSFSVESRCFLPADRRAAAWALAFAKAAGMCLMIGYSVFKVPGEAKRTSHSICR